MSDVRKKTLTDRFLRSLKPLKSTDPEYRRPIWDTVMPGLCVRPGAHPSFYVGKRSPGSPKFVWVKLGDYPVMALAEARTGAAAAVQAIAGGHAVPPRSNAVTFADAAERFIEQCLAGKRTRVEIEQLIRGKLVPALGHRPIAGITHNDLVAVLRSIADQTVRTAAGRHVSGGPHAARKALVHLRVLFRWAAFNRIGGVQTDPSVAIPASELLRGRQFNRARDRILSDGELRAVWRAAEAIGYPFGSLIQALILTGQRLSELAEARWSEIEGASLFAFEREPPP